MTWQAECLGRERTEKSTTREGRSEAQVDLRNRWVHFRIRDVYLPEPQELAVALHGDDLLQGRVLDLSDNLEKQGRYAVVEVEGFKDFLIVPVERILGVL